MVCWGSVAAVCVGGGGWLGRTDDPGAEVAMEAFLMEALAGQVGGGLWADITDLGRHH